MAACFPNRMGGDEETELWFGAINLARCFNLGRMQEWLGSYGVQLCCSGQDLGPGNARTMQAASIRIQRLNLIVEELFKSGSWQQAL